MNLKSIGRNIRAFRLSKKVRQEDLAESVGLSVNYIGMIERGERMPSLETFISIANALKASTDILLRDVLDEGYKIKSSLLTEKLETLSTEDRARILDIMDTLLRHSGNAGR